RRRDGAVAPLRNFHRPIAALAGRGPSDPRHQRCDRPTGVLFPRTKPWGDCVMKIVSAHAARITAATFATLAAITPAHAHLIGTRFGDFYAGAFHPITDLNDVLLWLALGLLAGSLQGERSRWLVLLFPLGLACGFVLSTSAGIAFGGDATNATLI